MQQYSRSFTRYSDTSVNLKANYTKFLEVYLLIFLLTTSTLAMAEEHKQLKEVLYGNGLFTKNLYQILAKTPGNVFFSPISIHAVLSMTAQGSDKGTKEAFTQALNVQDVGVAAEGYKEVMSRLNAVTNVTLLIANKIFIKESYALQDAFKSVVTGNFYSEVDNIDFTQNQKAAKTINSWVEDKTNNKIKDLVSADDLDEDTRLVLVNAIYFKGKWAHPFNVSFTKTEKFYVTNQETIDVQMMHIKQKFSYKNDENLDAQVLELPYANKDISMIIILPNKKDGINELEQKLANVDLTKITENMYRPDVEVSLPRFKIETTMDLGKSLTELGLGPIFSDTADFSKMLASPEALKVSKVIQKAFIEVNEEGAEAAAATAVIMMVKCSMGIPRPPITFIANHPFVIVLQINQEGNNILFKGRINKPADLAS